MLTKKAPAFASAFKSFRTALEQQFHRNLELARRAGITRGISRSADHTEGGVRSGEDRTEVRVGKVRMIEQVEGLYAQLVAQPFGDLGRLGKRKVHVLEIRTGDRIAAKISKVENISGTNNAQRQSKR